MDQDSPTEQSFRIITFYSYKGGVGRSMALANVAALLAQIGRRVLIVDFDLEAPGLQRYFEHDGIRMDMRSSTRRGRGLVDLFHAYRQGKEFDWRRCLVKIRWPAAKTAIDLLPAGGDASDYAELVQSLNWEQLFREHKFGDYLCRLREAWRAEYDFVLIDSRTGMSDIGGICTILLPDALVMLFTANQQSIEGTAEVVRRARAAQETLPVERGRMLAIPMLSRDDRRTEYEQSEEWRLRIADAMEDFFSDWVWTDVTAEAVLSKLYLPQIAYWSFGERLPVIERPRELADPSSLGAAYDRLARLIDADLQWKAVTAETGSSPAEREPPPVGGQSDKKLILVPWIVIGLLLLALAYVLMREPPVPSYNGFNATDPANTIDDLNVIAPVDGNGAAAINFEEKKADYNASDSANVTTGSRQSTNTAATWLGRESRSRANKK